MWSPLEPIAEIDGDQIRISLVSAVEIIDALPIGAALLEVKSELGGIEDPWTALVADAEADADAIGVRKNRADVERWLRILVVECTESNVPVRRNWAISAQAVRERVLPVRHSSGGTERRRVHQVDRQRLEATPAIANDVGFDIPFPNCTGRDAEVSEVGHGDGGFHWLRRWELRRDHGIELRVSTRNLRDGRRSFEID